MARRILPTIIAAAALASAAYTLNLLDRMVYETLYAYGLQFSYDWANPYWTLLRVTWVLLAICAMTITANAILIVRSGSKEKQPSVKIAPTQERAKNIFARTQTRERPPTPPIARSPQPPPKLTPQPAPTIATTPSYANQDASSLYKCTHCGKSFTQPLRMLNFQVEPPRIVNVCPFCNETMPSGPTVKESEQAEKKFYFRRNNEHIQESLTH